MTALSKALRYLLHRFDLEFLRVPLAAHHFALHLKTIASGVSSELMAIQATQPSFQGADGLGI